MEDDEIEAQACKFQRIENGTINDSNNNNKNIELRRKNVGGISDNNFQSCWQQNNSSRIVRVSRASGGKDRHSKVMTSKGLRDRRVRLSVTTAIQFYDLQDRLGYDQPSKAVDWLIKAASDPISELPSLNNTFPHTPSDDKIQQQGFEFDQMQNNNNNNNLNSLSKSACSSTSETSKGSEIHVNRVKARERARERATKEKQNESSIVAQQQHQHISQTASFTELLTGRIGNSTNNVTVPTRTSPNGSVHEQIHQWSSNVTPMDYFSSGLLVGNSSNSRTHNQSCSTASSPSSGFSGQIQLGHSHSHSLPVSPFSSENENHSDQIQLQHFPFMSEHHLMPQQQQQVVTSSSSSHQPSHGNDNYNLNFTISSSGLVGYNRGTLQSNSLLPHLQRFSSMDGTSTSSSNNLPFFIGASTPAVAAAPPTMDNNHQQHLQFSPLFDARLQLFYGDGSSHSDQKGKCNKN